MVVSTDAIGMGPICPSAALCSWRRASLTGVNKRTLNPEEITDCGPRGRFGLYDEGFVAAIDDGRDRGRALTAAADHEGLCGLPGAALKSPGADRYAGQDMGRNGHALHL